MALEILHLKNEVLLITPERLGDERGFFSEIYNGRELALAGFDRIFVQENHSLSVEAGTVRGLHFQAPPRAQDKLVYVVSGAVIDVAVDIRLGSPTYGLSVTAELNAENGCQLLVPRGFAHGFQTLRANTEVLYKVSEYYAPDAEGGLLWCDPALEIEWPILARDSILNERDKAWPMLADFKSPFSL